VAAIISKLIESEVNTRLLDLQVQDGPSFGIVTEPAGNVYHGCEIGLNIEQLGEV